MHLLYVSFSCLLGTPTSSLHSSPTHRMNDRFGDRDPGNVAVVYVERAEVPAIRPLKDVVPIGKHPQQRQVRVGHGASAIRDVPPDLLRVRRPAAAVSTNGDQDLLTRHSVEGLEVHCAEYEIESPIDRNDDRFHPRWNVESVVQPLVVRFVGGGNDQMGSLKTFGLCEPQWRATKQLVALGISRPLMPALKDVRHQVVECPDEENCSPKPIEGESVTVRQPVTRWTYP